MATDKDPYAIEEGDDEAPGAGPEEVVEPSSGSEHPVKALDVCPNCSSPMPGAGSLVCMRCGFDLKTMRVVETRTGASADKAAKADEEEQADPLVREVPSDKWLPLTLAGVGLAVLTIGALAGWRGLFPGAEEGLPIPSRLLGLVRWPLLVGVGTACGVGGLAAGAEIMKRPVGDLVIATRRVFGLVTISFLAAFVDTGWGEFLVQAVIQAVILTIGFVVLFALPPARGATITAFTLSLFFTVFGLAELVAWAM